MKKVPVALFLVWMMVSYVGLASLDFGSFKALTNEDGPVESLGALAFFLASLMFFYLFFRDRRPNDFFLFKTKRNIFYLLLGCVFFFGAGEEISWGQRLFNLEVPEAILARNAQNELNLHNLHIFHGLNDDNERKGFFALLLNMDRLFSIFWFSYCLLLPISHNVSCKTKNFLERVNLPLTTISMGFLFICNYIFSKIMQFNLGSAYNNGIVELKETIFAVLFLTVSINFYLERKRSWSLATSLPSSRPQFQPE